MSVEKRRRVNNRPPPMVPKPKGAGKTRADGVESARDGADGREPFSRKPPKLPEPNAYEGYWRPEIPESPVVIPDKIPLPDATELAKIAATLIPTGEPFKAMPEAMRYYVQAVLFLHNMPSEPEYLVTRYGDQKRSYELLVRPIREAYPDLRVVFDLDDKLAWQVDPVRKYLSDNGVLLKTGRGVRERIKRHFGDAEAILATSRQERDGRIVYALLKPILDGLLRATLQQRSEKNRATAKRRREKARLK